MTASADPTEMRSISPVSSHPAGTPSTTANRAMCVRDGIAPFFHAKTV
ncbi:hypothetical protein LHK_01675 [Laribacter hongkongensis HLHK9]|uniref:Uncharacterized protein n=1 Tax=Laribacter hongkongensis (strain HLHK9) TaxID=557598 RepID=C1D870_LARHH|nr:hypothetical protein LHK_01675 [Laribacter hongkongensis HLHK9]